MNYNEMIACKKTSKYVYNCIINQHALEAIRPKCIKFENEVDNLIGMDEFLSYF